jgi:hypothetical protein
LLTIVRRFAAIESSDVLPFPWRETPGMTMGAPSSPRVDAISKLAPNMVNANNQVAKAEGLTEDEAIELATWLKGEGYHVVGIHFDEPHYSVQWTK